MFRFEITRTISLSFIISFVLGSYLDTIIMYFTLLIISKYYFINNYIYTS